MDLGGCCLHFPALPLASRRGVQREAQTSEVCDRVQHTHHRRDCPLQVNSSAMSHHTLPFVPDTIASIPGPPEYPRHVNWPWIHKEGHISDIFTVG